MSPGSVFQLLPYGLDAVSAKSTAPIFEPSERPAMNDLKPARSALIPSLLLNPMEPDRSKTNNTSVTHTPAFPPSGGPATSMASARCALNGAPGTIANAVNTSSTASATIRTLRTCPFAVRVSVVGNTYYLHLSFGIALATPAPVVPSPGATTALCPFSLIGGAALAIPSTRFTSPRQHHPRRARHGSLGSVRLHVNIRPLCVVDKRASRECCGI